MNIMNIKNQQFRETEYYRAQLIEAEKGEKILERGGEARTMSRLRTEHERKRASGPSAKRGWGSSAWPRQRQNLVLDPTCPKVSGKERGRSHYSKSWRGGGTSRACVRTGRGGIASADRFSGRITTQSIRGEEVDQPNVIL